MHALRHLLGRAKPTVMEVEILHGLARQILHGKDKDKSVGASRDAKRSAAGQPT